MSRFTLGSASPRRRELLSALEIPFDVMPSQADESLPQDLNIDEALRAVALRKACDVADRTGRAGWILAADTAVVVEGRVFGKPNGRGAAAAMLRTLSGRAHRVITAVALLGPGCERSISVETEVVFRELTDLQIDWYTSLDEPYDKAGAYAIQGRGAFMVATINGSFTNVVGLPMAETVDLLEQTGLTSWPADAAGREIADA